MIGLPLTTTERRRYHLISREIAIACESLQMTVVFIEKPMNTPVLRLFGVVPKAGYGTEGYWFESSRVYFF